jgi:AcrR family transcriptional regulator
MAIDTAAGADTRTRQARGRRRRQQILDSAVELFAAKGYRSTGILTLAERIGLSDTGLLYYFGTKERLLHEVVAERPRAHFPVSSGELTLAHLRNLGRRYVYERTITRLYIVLAGESIESDDVLHEFFVSLYRRGVDAIRAVLERDRSRGAIRDDVDLTQVAREVLALELGSELMWLMDPASIDMATFREKHIDRVVRDLAPKDN